MRETDQEQRDRKEAETSEYRKERQLRLGHISAPEEKEEKEEKKSASKKEAASKKSE